MKLPQFPVRTITLTIALTLAASAGYANDEKQKTIKDRDVVKAKADEVVCKRVKTTGSHFKKKVCMKASKWVEMQRDSQETLRAVAGPAGKSGS